MSEYTFPAFPCTTDNGVNCGLPGMNLRDYFAAKAMQGLISEPSIQATAAEFAQRAYMVADAMLKEREA